MDKIYYTSLFSCAGIGETFLQNLGIESALANELLGNRALWYLEKYKNTTMIPGDIMDDKVFNQLVAQHLEKKIAMCLQSCPCQDFSTAGKRDTSNPRAFLYERGLEFLEKVMQQYTQGTFPTPWGGNMRVAVTKLTYWDKEGENIEVKGHKPDINCSGQDAFSTAINIGIDNGRTIGFREKNEKESGIKVYAEYDPRAATDSRKAYYAKYLEPAITEIEKKNIVANRLCKLRENACISDSKRTITKLRGTSSSEIPYKPQTTTITPQTLKLYQGKKQNS